jgi:hypothetical protein
MTAPDHMLRRSENPCIEGGIQTWMPIGGQSSAPIVTFKMNNVDHVGVIVRSSHLIPLQRWFAGPCRASGMEMEGAGRPPPAV